jgi:hypothetical protein
MIVAGSLFEEWSNNSWSIKVWRKPDKFYIKKANPHFISGEQPRTFSSDSLVSQ